MADRADAVSRGRFERARWLGLGAIAAAQLALLAWWLVAPLPSAESLRAKAAARGEAADSGAFATLRRVHFLLRADDLMAEAARNLNAPDQLVDRLPILATTGAITAAALGLGLGALRLLRIESALPSLARWPIAFAVGSNLLASLTLGLGCLGGLEPGIARAALGVLGFGFLGMLISPIRKRFASRELPDAPRPQRRARDPRKRTSDSEVKATAVSLPNPWRPRLGLVALTAPVCVLMLLGALQPTIEYDALEYHLQGPKEFYQAGAIDFLAHNVYTNMPFSVEMMHTLGMTALGDWKRGALAGQAWIALCAPLTAAVIAATAWRWGSGRAAWFAAFVYLTTPWVYRLAVHPFVEGPLCLQHAGALFAAGFAWTRPNENRPRGAAWLLVGLLAGGAMAVKYPGLVSAVFPFGLVAMTAAGRARSARPVAAYSLGVLIAVGPWLLKNAILTGNPVYPLAFDLFGGRGWNAELDAKWWHAHGPRPVSWATLQTGLWDVLGRSDWQSPLFVLFAPLAFLKRNGHLISKFLGIYILYSFLTWYFLTHRLDRFWIPLLPAAAILAGLGADWTRRRSWRVWIAAPLTIATLANLAMILTPITGPTNWTAPLERLFVEVPASVNPPLARLNRALPPDAKPLLVGQAAVFSLDAPEVAYSTVFNPERFAEWTDGRSSEEIHRILNEQSITHLYVDWVEIARHREPGGYGFDERISRAHLERLVADGVLSPPTRLGPDHWLYRVEEAEGG